MTDVIVSNFGIEMKIAKFTLCFSVRLQRDDQRCQIKVSVNSQKILYFQLVTMTLLVILGAMGKVTRKRKRRVDRLNTTAMVFSLFTTVINIAITSFGSSNRANLGNMNKYNSNFTL